MTLLSSEQVKNVKARLPGVVECEPMSAHTSLHVGGPARLFVSASSSDDLVYAVETALDIGVPFYIFGGGSNLLVADQGFEGLMIQAANRGMRIEGETVVFESGVATVLAARACVEAGLSGFEWAVGIPGTLGGAVYGNAGCFGGEMKDIIVSVEAFRLKDRKRVRLTNADCQFGYRESLFKHETHVILGCVLKLQGQGTRDKGQGTEHLKEILEKRKDSQPLGGLSCGCLFKNFEYQDESALSILKRHVDKIPAEMLARKRLSAGWLIDQAGMMGKRVGGMEVSDKHGNFFLNKGQATASDVIALASFVKMKVRDEFGIELQEEVQLVGF